MTPNDGPDAAPSAPDQPDQPDRPDVDAKARPADAPPGSVAAEAALLVDLLSGRSWSNRSRMPSSGVRGERAGGSPHDHDHSAGPTSATGDRSGPEPTTTQDGPAGECTCGGATPAACRVCPVCQLIAFVQQVNPDTIEKVADFVGFAATALRDLATAQRERRSEPAPDTDEADTPGTDDDVTDEKGRGGSA